MNPIDLFFEGLRGAIRFLLGIVQDNLLGVTANSSLFSPIATAIPGVYGFAQAVQQNVTGPVGYSILGFCVLVTVYEHMTKNNEFATGTKSFEAVIISLMSLVILKVVVDHAGVVMEFVYWIFNNVTLGINTIPAPGATGSGMNDPAWIDSIITSITGDGKELAFYYPALLAALVSFIASLAAQIVILARFIELYVLLALSPIPLATLASSHSSEIGKGFLKNFIACVLQAAVILLVVRFFPPMLASMASAVGSDPWQALAPPIIYSVVMLVTIVGSSGITRKVVGL